MKKGKVHYYDTKTTMGMPLYLRNEYGRQGLDGSICGYMRKTTTFKEEVTCFYCKKEMERRGVK